MSPPRVDDDPHPTPPARELLASALQRVLDTQDRVETRLRAVEREVSRAGQEREQHRETVGAAIAATAADHRAHAEAIVRLTTLVEGLLRQEQAQRDHAARWWDRALAAATSGPALALVSPVVTLLLAALGLWLGVPLPQQGPAAAPVVVAPATAAPEAP